MGINISISKETADSASGFPALPAGNYHATIKKVKLGEYASGNQKGKPFYSIQFRVSEGDFAGRTLFETVGLFDKFASGKSNFMMPQFFKALGYDMSAGDFEVPDQEELAGQAIVLKVSKASDPENSFADDAGFVNNVRGYINPEAEGAKVAKADTGKFSL